jgi:hypothetical protein
MPKSSASEIWNSASMRFPPPAANSPGATTSSPKAKSPGLQGAGRIQLVASLAAMFPPECIDEGEDGGR